MSEGTTEGFGQQAATWETLEQWVQGKVQELIQAVPEAEVTELLGRCKSQRRATAAVTRGCAH